MRRPRLITDQRGSALISVVLVALLIGAVGAMALETGRQADWSSASDRNSEVALGVAEAGVHQAVAKMEALAAAGTIPTAGPFTGATAEGSYSGTVYRCVDPLPTPCADMGIDDGYVIESAGSVGGQRLGRGRSLRVALEPPPLFPDGGQYALFSKTSIELKNNDHIFFGDVWANENVLLENNAIHNGSITAARGWIKTESGSSVSGNVWSGHYNSGGWAIDIGGSVGGWAKASVSAASCENEIASNYNVRGGTVSGNVTTFGAMTSGTAGSKSENTCTQAPAPKAVPGFTFDPANYDPETLHEFSSAAEFNAYNGPYVGTFRVNEPSPSQARRLDLSGWSITGSVTIVTNAPIYTNAINDDALPSGSAAELVLVSSYRPPTATGCSVNHDNSECSIHAKNHLSATCKTAVLMYAHNGPVAIKNNSKMCGSVISDGILIKNNQDLNYDERFDRVSGFGEDAFVIGRWEELPS